MKHYAHYGMAVPVMWVEEYNELLKRIKKE